MLVLGQGCSKIYSLRGAERRDAVMALLKSMTNEWIVQSVKRTFI